MKEQVRQFVIFGNFNSINFENVNVLENVKKQFDFQINGEPDIPTMKSFEPIIQQNIVIRPVLKSSSSNFSVFFGTERIHVQELDCSVDTYDEFLTNSLEIIKNICEKYGLIINRIALNGTILIDEKEKQNAIFSKVLCSNDMFDNNPDECQFRVNKKVFDTILECNINKIFSINKGKIISPNGPQDIYAISYDYNTEIGTQNNFDLDKINSFSKEGLNYRDKVVNN